MVNVFDIAGVLFILRNAKAGVDNKVLAVGLGWSCADAVLGKLIPLLVMARDLEHRCDRVGSVPGAGPSASLPKRVPSPFCKGLSSPLPRTHAPLRG